MPTGEKDPFALRRHALGVLRMLIEKQLPVSFEALLGAAWRAESVVKQVKDESAALKSFFMDRLRVMLRDLGYSANEVDAVLAIEPDSLLELPKRLNAVRAFMQLPEAAPLTAANKRIGNILKKSEDAVSTTVDATLLVEAAEKALYDALVGIEPEANALYDAGDYESMLAKLAQLKTPVDAFFEGVMVNSEDERLRLNRLALLQRLYTVMNRVANIARLAA